MKNSLANAAYSSSAPLYIVLDISTSPLYGRLQRGLFETAKTLRESLLFTPNEAGNWLGIDMPKDTNGIRDKVWINNTLIIAGTTPIKETITTPTGNPTDVTPPPIQPSPQTQQKRSQTEKFAIDKLSKLVNELRIHTLKNLGKPLFLKDFDRIAKETIGDADLKRLTRTIYSNIKNTDKSEEAIKEVFNSLTRNDNRNNLINYLES